MKEKVKLLEAAVQKMFLNVINLEAELNNKKITIKDKAISVESIGEEAKVKNWYGRWQQQEATYS